MTDRDEAEMVALERSWARLTAASPALELTLGEEMQGHPPSMPSGVARQDSMAIMTG